MKNNTENRYIVGNWKMNQQVSDVHQFMEKTAQLKTDPKVHRWIAPQSIHIAQMLSSHLTIGAQNCSEYTSGAFTGEISCPSLKDLGADFVILGHSERRSLFKESNEIINKKIKTALGNHLKVILCIGESLAERESAITEKILLQQLSYGLNNCSYHQDVLIAYEPVWAIGTGKVASTQQIASTHHFIFQQLLKLWGQPAQNTPILYGGSVKPNNFSEIIATDHVDGALVGGASLLAQDYNALCEIAAKI